MKKIMADQSNTMKIFIPIMAVCDLPAVAQN